MSIKSFSIHLLLFSILSTPPYSFSQNADAEKRQAQILKRFPEADLDKDGKLSRAEFQKLKEKRDSNTG